MSFIQISGLMRVSEHEAEMARKDAEIERWSNRYKDTVNALVEKDKLITELADALFDMAPDPHDEFFGPLIEKAREAVK